MPQSQISNILWRNYLLQLHFRFEFKAYIDFWGRGKNQSALFERLAA